MNFEELCTTCTDPEASWILSRTSDPIEAGNTDGIYLVHKNIPLQCTTPL